LSAIGPGEPVEVRAADGWFYLLEDSPGTVLRLDRANLAISASAQVPGKVESFALDSAADRLWAWYTQPNGNTLAREFVASTLAPVRDVPITGEQVFRGVALDGALWLASSDGLYRIGPSDPAARLVPGLTGLYAIAVDPGRHRLILDQGPATAQPGLALRVAALDPVSLKLTYGAQLPLIKDGIAVVAGQVWIGGFASGADPVLYRLDPTTLQVAGTAGISDQLGPGAIVTAGTNSLWVQGGADDNVYCLSPETGTVRQQWRANLNSIASLPGMAIAVLQPNLVQLEVTKACAG
jgi:hypothetical protein